MKEMRCIVFTEREVVQAVIDRRRRRKDPVPYGTVETLHYTPKETGVETVMTIVDDHGGREVLNLGEAEVAAAMVAFCMGRKVPLPAAGQKSLTLISNSLALTITMNFEKKAKLVPGEQRPSGS